MGSTAERRSATMIHRRRGGEVIDARCVAAVATAGLAITCRSAQDAATWPSKPVRIVVPASAGGIADADGAA